jgi:hypothetical protein
LPILSHRQFLGWVAFDRVEPDNAVRADRRSGEIAAVIANLTKKRGDKAVRWTDFFPEHDPARGPKRRMSDADIWRALLEPVTGPLAGARKATGRYAAEPKKGR